MVTKFEIKAVCYDVADLILSVVNFITFGLLDKWLYSREYPFNLDWEDDE